MKKLTPNIRKIAANTGWLFADRILRMGVGFVVWIWVANYLGPSDFGLLNYALALVTLLSPLTTLGLDNLIVKDIVENKENKDVSIGTAFFMRIAGSIVVFAASMVIVLFLRPGDTVMFWMVAIIAFTTFIQTFDVIDYWFQSLVRSKYTVIARNIAFLIAAGLRVYLISIKAPVVAFAWMTLVEALISAVGVIFFYHYTENNIFHWRVKLAKVKGLIKNSLLITVSSTAVLLYMKIDILLLGEMSTEASVGIYSAAAKVSEVFYFVATIMSSSVFPIIISESEIYYDRLKKMFDLMTFIAYLIILPLFFFAPLVIGAFGSKYASASPVLSVHVWATMFVFLGVAQSSWYIKEGTKGLVMQLRRTILGAVINIVLNIFLIPAYDSYGAAISTIIAYAYVGYFANMFSKETFGIFKMQTRSLFLVNYINKIFAHA